MIAFVKSLLRADAPLVVVTVLAVVLVWWWRRPSSRGPRRLLVAFLAVFYLAATPIGADLLVAGLAHGMTRITTREEARGADAVVVLSGGVQTVKTADTILSQLPVTASLRILEAVRVYKLIGTPLVIVSGGIADERRELKPEGEQMATALVASGVPADRIVLDLEAKNTHDHPRTVRRLLEAHRIHQFVLVTSPTHMRRALYIFRKAGYDPASSVALLRSEQLASPLFLMPNDDSMMLSDQAFYEYGAWVLDWWRGWLR